MKSFPLCVSWVFILEIHTVAAWPLIGFRDLVIDNSSLLLNEHHFADHETLVYGNMGPHQD